MSQQTGELFDLFWENSKLNPVTIRVFRRRIDEYLAANDGARPALQYPSADVLLERPHDRLARLMEQRRSERRFSETPVSAAALGRLFAAFAGSRDGSRTYASAGGAYPLEIFCLLNRVEGPLGGSAVYYNADNHSVSVVARLPGWDELAGIVNLELSEGVPQLVFLFVLFPGRSTAKYGERGGRFALLEAGHAAQNLALRLVAEGMAGCEAGGLLDDRVKRLLGLEGTTAQVALGYACGLPTHSRFDLPHDRPMNSRPPVGPV
jgi:SagB-type dehydrogenase family enzyme